MLRSQNRLDGQTPITHCNGRVRGTHHWRVIVLAAAALVATTGSAAVDIELLTPGQAAGTAAGVSTPIAVSRSMVPADDGRFVLFASSAANVVAGVGDANGRNDVFLLDRQTGSTVLVSRSASSTRTGNRESTPVALSADGRFVLFQSQATDLVAGVVDLNEAEDVYLYDRITNRNRLLSHAAGNPGVTGNGRTVAVAMTPDASRVLWQSLASDLVAGSVDGNAATDVHVYNSASDTTTLVSVRLQAPGQTANGPSYAAAISDDGRIVLYGSAATDLVGNVLDQNDVDDVFRFDLETETASMLSSVDSFPIRRSANGRSTAVALSADGRHALLHSRASNLGATDNNAVEDVYVHDRATGLLTAISLAAGSSTTGDGASLAVALSADGRHVLFQSRAPNLIAGVVDTNFVDDAYLHDLATATTTLVSRRSGLPLGTPNAASQPVSISADGQRVLYGSQAGDIVGSGPLDYSHVYVFDAQSAQTTRISHRHDSNEAGANGWSVPRMLSANGQTVLFASRATDLRQSIDDRNQANDAYLSDRGGRNTELISRTGAATRIAADQATVGGLLSSDGAVAVITTAATDLAAGHIDGNQQWDVYLRARGAATATLVSRSQDGQTPANGMAGAVDVSADGRFVLYHSTATNVVAGVVDDNGGDDVFLYDHLSGSSVLVSRTRGVGPPRTGDGESQARALSADGRYALFSTRAPDLVPDIVDTNEADDVYVYDRQLDSLELVSHWANFVGRTANDASAAVTISDDGRWILFDSRASDLVPGQIDPFSGTDVFLYDRVDNQTTMVSHSSASPATAGGSLSQGAALCGDGSQVLLLSAARNLLAGITDTNGEPDAYLYDHAQQQIALVTHAAGLPSVTANSGALDLAISDDCRIVSFHSEATDLVAGASDSTQTLDVFVHDRATAQSSYVSHAWGAPANAGNGLSYSQTGVSADGRYVWFRSQADNLLAAAPNAAGSFHQQAYRFDRLDGSVQLVSRALAFPEIGGDRSSELVAIDASGQFGLLLTDAGNLVLGDGNETVDLFRVDMQAEAVHVDGFED